MSLNQRFILLGMYAAALVNIGGVLLFSLGYSNARLSELSPVVFSSFGLLSIQLWGLAYAAAARQATQLPLLLAVFAIEKLVYVVTWLSWMGEHAGTLPQLLAEAPLTGMFYVIYGPTDFAFGLFFALVAVQSRRGS